MTRSRRSGRPSRRAGPETARERYSSGTPWEPKVGYSRAVRVGPRIYVSGTTATAADGSVVGRDDPYAQTVRALDNIETALSALGSRREAIVRLRIFVTRLDDFEEVARALGERFRSIRPAATLVEVSRLVDPAMRVEVEADADEGSAVSRRPGPRSGPRRSGGPRHRARRGRRRPS
jgi:enamine deaminase RidA (YjgF/YER057c/UK114 family)